MSETEEEDSMRLVKGIMSPQPREMEQIKEQGYVLAVEMEAINRAELISEKYVTPEALDALWDASSIRVVIYTWD